MVQIASFLALPLAVLAAALPNEDSSLQARQSEDCVINRAFDSMWDEYGMNRRKVTFTSINTDGQLYCDKWAYAAPYPNAANNLQCGVDGETGWVDVSYAKGPAGDTQFDTAMADTLLWWRQDTHCRVE